jgi:transcriptional regulator with XRE-family HTH domain
MTPVYDDPKALGARIAKARKAAEYTSQQALADRLGYSVGTIKRWESGDEKSLGKNPAARRTVAVIVAEATGRWDLLDLAPAEADFPDWIDEARDLRGLLTKLAGEVVALQKAGEETQSRLLRLEREG